VIMADAPPNGNKPPPKRYMSPTPILNPITAPSIPSVRDS